MGASVLPEKTTKTGAAVTPPGVGGISKVRKSTNAKIREIEARLGKVEET